MKSLLMKFYFFLMDTIAFIQWKGIRKWLTGKEFNLEVVKDWNLIKRHLAEGYYIILTEDRSHLSSWAVKLGHYLMTRKWPTYTHALCNVEADGEVDEFKIKTFKFVEALNKGVQFSPFEKVFNCDSMVLLKPKYYSQDQFDQAMQLARTMIGKKYDKLFKYDNQEELSCVEVVRSCMMSLPHYETEMRVFEHMIKHEKNLTPQMFRDCPDFEIVLEINR